MCNEIKFAGHRYANAKMLINDNAVTLRSYNTIVAGCDIYGWIVCRGTYSRTTIKHIGWFARECAAMLNTSVTYYDFKAIAGENVRYNVYTGEIKVI